MAKARTRANGEGSIFHRGRDDKWVAELVVGWTPDGKKQVMRCTKDTRREAQSWLTKQLNDRENGNLVKPVKDTLGSFLLSWLETTASHALKPKTLIHYQETVRHYVEPHLGHIELQKLTGQDLQAFYHTALTKGFPSKHRPEPHPLSPRTVEIIHNLIHKGLKQAVDWGLLQKNPADSVQKPKVPKPKMHFLTAEEAGRLIEASQEERLHALIVVLLTCGLRIGEALGLRWQDVNLDEGTLTVEQTLSVTGNRLVFSTPKTESSLRTLILPALTLAALKKWRKEQLQERLLVGEPWENPDLVFTSTIGTPVHPGNFRKRVFYPLLESAGVPHIRLHDCRHTTATLLLANGADVKTVQDWMGHSDARITLNVYVHSLMDTKRAAAATMDNLLGQKQQKTGG